MPLDNYLRSIWIEDFCILQMGDTYSEDVVWKIRILYIVSIVAWILLIVLMGWYRTDIIGVAILSAPVIVYIISLTNAAYYGPSVEEEMFQGNFISFGFLIAVILINWTRADNKEKLFRILMISLILMMFSLIDVWIARPGLIIEKHIRTILQTASLVLLVFSLYVYYVDNVAGSHGSSVHEWTYKNPANEINETQSTGEMGKILRV